MPQAPLNTKHCIAALTILLGISCHAATPGPRAEAIHAPLAHEPGITNPPADLGWSGQLTVLAHQGRDCASQPTPPYELPVVAIPRPGLEDLPGQAQLSLGMPHGTTHLLVGPMQSQWLVNAPIPTQQAAHPAASRSPTPVAAPQWLQVLGENEPAGELTLLPASPDGTASSEWRWHEAGAPDAPGCAYTEARLRRHTQAAPAGAQTLARELLVFAHLSLQLRSAATPAEAQAPAQALAAQGQAWANHPPDTLVGDLADRLLRTGEWAQALRQRASALALVQAATALYRRQPQVRPEDLANALARQAALLRRQEGAQQAEASLQEAITLLQAHGQLATPVGASLLGLRGAWRLRDGQAQLALEDFQRAADIQAGLPSALGDWAAALNNMAQALQQLGRTTEAQGTFDLALRKAEQAGAAEAPLADAIRRSRDRLRAPASPGATPGLQGSALRSAA